MIGERLAQVRSDHDNTQQDLADKLNVSIHSVRSWEQGKSSPSHETLVIICKLYKVSSDYLLGLTDIRPSYGQNKNSEKFSVEELLELEKYKDFLIWKRKK